ncbi:MAG: hypothetical protein CO092_02630 [Candidatus Aenigmarchaeota archaeon CG_4_9_14_3_um_filter_37_18]|nr:AAA family ATPase [Candidatus Aenigmarchaeota archaeon]OIN88617.1 MAG: hypothetical protein AUJ50_00270 [Candidatus Aenigmarchaeota archaeon CG1_02_38_14]PIV68466.1 MAG: hypothetical protein COS07_04000 [Candidatus Aenigmarchaeota archaeon CG01_land_8_20_14_3_00_37_9]PIX50972.1 MAG: hypothetical protein COZ52_01385 [Candidatus Aenigmarchaeota archaeon CG_4_8_14_3_um_filter_37_24]PIY36371.1 MAG: hypothetical protein COZ04_00605 [Candidatus Aenigmarchaeota archaeon CG_4_10_14_3_um_filter_37_21
MINKIQLKNWRSHLDTDLEFTSGTNAILGPMGSGKSSVMNAICFGLFGTFPDLQTRKIKLDDIIMNKPSVKNESQISVDFTIDDKTYTVMRVIERNKGTTYSEIREGDKLLDSPNAQRVTELVEKLLKINYELFSRAIYSEQNGLDYFLRLSRGERMKRIDNLLMIDKFEGARSNAVTLRNRLAEKKDALQSVADIEDFKELKKNLDDIDYSLKKLNETKSNLSKEFDEKKINMKSLEKEVKELEGIEKTLNTLNNRKNSLEGSMKEVKHSIDNFRKDANDKTLDVSHEELKDTEKLIKKHQEELNKSRKEQEALTRNISENETKIGFLESKIKEIQTDISKKLELENKISSIEKEFGKNLIQALEKKKEELEAIQRTNSELLTKIEQTEESLSKISKTHDKCPVCESKISTERRSSLIADYQDRIKSYNGSLKENKEAFAALKQMVKETGEASKNFEIYSEKIKEFKGIEKEIEEKKKDHRTLIEAVSRKKQDLEKNRSGISEIEESLEKSKNKQQQLKSAIEKLIDLKDKEEKFSNLENQLEELNKEISGCSKKTSDKNLEKLRITLTETASRISEISARINGLVEIILERENRRKDCQIKIQQAEKQKEEIKLLESLVLGLKIFEKALEKTQTQLRENFVDTVNYTMDQIWPDIYPYKDFGSARLGIKERDYILQVQSSSGEWIDVDGIVSGGERSIASLALRIAFSSVLAPQLKWLVLDEPTHNLDSKAVEDLSETLKTRVGDFADQVFLITHEKTLENAVTGQLYRLSRNKELDDFSRIEKVN